MHKDLKDLDRSERSETKMAALGRDDERLDPCTRVFFFWRQFLNATAKLCSFVQSQQR